MHFREAPMIRTKCCMMEICHLATVILLGLIGWKIARHWRAGFAEKTGHAVDASISAAAEKLEKAAIALEMWAASKRT